MKLLNRHVSTDGFPETWLDVSLGSLVGSMSTGAQSGSDWVHILFSMKGWPLAEDNGIHHISPPTEFQIRPNRTSSCHCQRKAHQRLTKRDRPPALEIHDHLNKASSDTDVLYKRDPKPQPMVLVDPAPAQQETPVDSDLPASRPGSATSSLDPYYFGISSPSDSPLPPLPPSTAITPDPPHTYEPVTPAKDPSSIDRRGLVGVGELATPRWTREEPYVDRTHDFERDDDPVEVIDEAEDVIDDEPDSPWTIEAVDGETSDREEVMEVKTIPRSIRTRPSMAEESGGEEILYPRQANFAGADVPKLPEMEAPKVSQTDSSSSEANVAASPPSAFTLPQRRAKKRTSDEFEMDQTGSLVSKRASSMSAKERSKDEVKPSSRRHRSLNAASMSSSILRDGRRERQRESAGLTLSGMKTSSSAKPEKHSRHASAGSPSSVQVDSPHSRRVNTTDFSHLPPSPSTSSIQQFLRAGGNPPGPNTPPLSSSSKDPLGSHHSPNVAHSLLRGTQEGWSGLDDEATAEALRKLDGLSGKTARARASVSSLGRTASSSRPGTPASKSGHQWEGVNENAKLSRRTSHKDTPSSIKEKEPSQRQAIGLGILSPGAESELTGGALSSDEQSSYSMPSSAAEKTPRKTGSSSARSSFTPKRGSTSSTTNGSTPTTSSRDSMSGATSITSVSATSGRQSSGKTRRNSAGSDVSSVTGDAASLKDRVASLAVNGDAPEETVVPPVPPLPKDLSTYRSPPSTAVGVVFPLSDDKPRTSHDSDRGASLEVPSAESTQSKQDRRRSQHASVNYTSASDSGASVTKTPSKKWSFSNALSLKLSGSPSSSKQSGYPVSPRAVTMNHQQIRKSTSKDQALSPSSASSSKIPWSPAQQPEAMSSAASLASLSSVGSVRTPALPSARATPSSKTPDRITVPSRSGTDSSASTNAGLSAPPIHSSGPLSPTSSVRRHQSKRLTPSSIPFFRRSSSQSMQLPPSSTVSSSPPTSTEMRTKQSSSPPHDYNPPSTSVPGSAQKKSSVLSLGLPSLLKGSSSRKSLHSDSKEAVKDAQRARDAAKEAEREKTRVEKEKLKKEEKDRSESRISALMGRKRGKTLSSTEPRKPKSPVHMPPMQISALEPATAQRVARLKVSGSSSASTSTPSTSAPNMARSTSSSRATSQTASSMQKQSDTSLRTRNQLPTIAGSPSVGTVTQTTKENKEPPPSSLMNSVFGHPKETPTKIPRISSRTSTVSSPPLKTSSSVAARRASTNVSGFSSSANPSPTNLSTNEFGVIEDGPTPKTTARTTPARASPTHVATSSSRVPRQVSASSTSIIPRKSNRDSMSFTGLRKSSTGSVTSTNVNESSTSHHRFSALSPSKGLKLLNPKISLSSARSSHTGSSQNLAQAAATPSSSRQSLTTPSPVPSSVDDEEAIGDEEMMQYIRRQHAKKLQNGATQEELDELLRFPEPLPPGNPLSPSAVLKSNQSQYLCEYERKEILDYNKVYYIGARSKKNFATLDNSTNNYGYDDDRGDYQVVNHDHLAFRYEIIDTLGKGSFGQVLHCRDHCTGESVAIKIIRNKKRFHHQALVEIKILDNLRKWDAEEKHHVIKMTEHFYFRNHLCIAMELLSINLYELIKANGFVGFTTGLIRRFTSQMLLSLSLMRHHRIVHCDLKPENVLLRHPAKSAIKVIDFGSSCFEHEKIYTYIQSRFYRSPEVILGMNYHMAIDMWSLGCILAELYTGFPIFPGENEQEQLSCIMEVLGVPDKEFVNRSSRRKLFFEPNGNPRAVVNSKGRRRRPGTKTLSQVLRCNDEEFVDFVAKCLVWDPEKRIKPQAAMRHPFITAGRRPKLPPSTSKSSSSTNTLSSRKKSEVTVTPKKSLISAPTPLTARSSRTTGNGVPTTPSSSSTHNNTLSSTSRSYRASQAHTGPSTATCFETNLRLRMKGGFSENWWILGPVVVGQVDCCEKCTSAEGNGELVSGRYPQKWHPWLAPSHLEGDASLATEILPGPPSIASEQQSLAKRDPKKPSTIFSYLPASDPGTTYSGIMHGTLIGQELGSPRKRARVEKSSNSGRAQRASARNQNSLNGAPVDPLLANDVAGGSALPLASGESDSPMALDDPPPLSRSNSVQNTLEGNSQGMGTRGKRKDKGKGKEVEQPVVRVKEEPRPISLHSPEPQSNLLNNNDHCSACSSTGSLVYCDGCPRAFHLWCIDPPLESVDDGKWFCPSCKAAKESPTPLRKHLFGPLATLIQSVQASNPVEYQLPEDIRTFFKDVTTGPKGAYVDASELKPPRLKILTASSSNSSRHGQLEDRDAHRLKDRNGQPVLCFRCGTSALPDSVAAAAPSTKRARKSTTKAAQYEIWKNIISCDYCNLHWHLDCLDPPLPTMPSFSKKWMCPNHGEKVLLNGTLVEQPSKRRIPKQNASTIEITKTSQYNNGNIEIVDPEAARPIDKQHKVNVDEVLINGRRYRVPERIILLDFWNKISKIHGVSQHNDTGSGNSSPLTSLSSLDEEEVNPLLLNKTTSDLNDLQVAQMLFDFQRGATTSQSRNTSIPNTAVPSGVNQAKPETGLAMEKPSSVVTSQPLKSPKAAVIKRPSETIKLPAQSSRIVAAISTPVKEASSSSAPIPVHLPPATTPVTTGRRKRTTTNTSTATTPAEPSSSRTLRSKSKPRKVLLDEAESVSTPAPAITSTSRFRGVKVKTEESDTSLALLNGISNGNETSSISAPPKPAKRPRTVRKKEADPTSTEKGEEKEKKKRGRKRKEREEDPPYVDNRERNEKAKEKREKKAAAAAVAAAQASCPVPSTASMSSLSTVLTATPKSNPATPSLKIRLPRLNFSGSPIILSSLATYQSEEADISASLSSLLSTRDPILSSLSRLQALVPQLDELSAQTNALSLKVAPTARTAERVGGRVQTLDEEMRRIRESSDRVTQVTDLKSSIDSRDWESATRHCARAMTLPINVIAGPFAQAVVTSDFILIITGQPTSENPLPPAQSLQSARELLLQVFKTNFEQASCSRDSAATSRFFKLFPTIGWEKEGLELYALFVVDLVKVRSPVAAKTSSPLYYITTLTSLFETIAMIVDQHQPVVEKYYGAGKMKPVVQHLLGECDRVVQDVFERWQEERQNPGMTPDDDPADPREIDQLLIEMAGPQEVDFTGEEVIPFSSIASQKVFEDLLAKYYTPLEVWYVRVIVDKAHHLSKVDSTQSAVITTTPDDVFYILKVVLLRLISTGSIATVDRLTDRLREVLEQDYSGVLKKKLDDVYRNTGNSSQLSREKAERENRIVFATILNDLDVSSSHLERLIKEMGNVGSINQYFMPSEQPAIRNHINSLSALVTKFRSTLRVGIELLFNQLIRPRLRTFLAEVYKEVSYVLDEDSYATAEYQDLVRKRFIKIWEGLVEEYKDAFTEGNFRLLFGLILDALLGAIRFDRDLRAVTGYLASQTAFGDGREKFVRLQQISTLLNLDHEEDVDEFYNGSGISWKLTLQEARVVTALKT
ncbi:hypothetical protein D9758_003147 [Tetrapyrgos nigripes]|uniref:dual-specificity kinase n=1 Tax=Tetrapyrgos nigripes TaxID=182062 RepID=A0A8H5GIY9_9AGAR|nr:hypothetical protein D9758_003147 [Tetrapyrgos nigripes]